MQAMSRSQIITVLAIVVVIVACFIPWMRVEEPTLLTITGVDTEGTRYGKPAYGHFIWSVLVLLCTFIPKIWAKRINLLFAACNLAWAIRNFAIIPSCDGGICPIKLTGLYLILGASVVIMITAFFPKEPPMKPLTH